MKRKGLIILAVIVLLAIFFHYFRISSNGIYRIYSVNSTTDAGDLGKKAAGLGQIAMCANIRNHAITNMGLTPNTEYFRDTCYVSYAVTSKDPSICEKVSPSAAYHASMRNDCVAEVARAVNDVSICYGIKSTQGDLGECVAQFKNPPDNNEICKTLSNQEDKEKCEELVDMRSR